MSQKIPRKFYPLQHKELIDLNKCLTGSELSVYLWLKTNDPFGERLVQADTKVIAEELNISRRSVQRALAKLQKEKLIDVVITKFFYRVRTKPTAESDDIDKVKERLRVTTPVSPDDINVANGTSMSPTVRECRQQYENVVIGTPMSSPKAETQSGQEVQNPKTLKTYTDFKKTLSEGEREDFLNFVREATRNLEKPINDLEAWLASKNAANQNRWEVYHKNYQEQKDKQKLRNSQQSSSEGYLTLDRQRAIAEFRKRMSLDLPANSEELQTKTEEISFEELKTETKTEEISSEEPEHKSETKKINSEELKTETETEGINSEEYERQRAEFDELLNNPPSRTEKSLAQLRREQIAKYQQQRQDLKRQQKEAAENYAKQIEQDPEKRKAEMLRQIAEFQQRQQQNPEINEINPSDSENE